MLHTVRTDLLQLPDSALLRDTEAAVIAHLSPVTLRRYRLRGDGPPYRRAGKRRLLYEKGALLRWIAGRTFTSTSQEAHPQRRGARARATA